MRKIIIALILVITLSSVVSAQEVCVGNYTAKVGENVTVNIVAKNFSSVAGILVKLNFNPNIATIEKVTINGMGCMKYDYLNNTAGFYRFVLLCINPITFSKSVVAKLIFKTLKSGKTAINVKAELSIYKNGKLSGEYPAIKNGSIVVKAESIHQTLSTSQTQTPTTTVKSTVRTNVKTTTITTTVRTTHTTVTTTVATQTTAHVTNPTTRSTHITKTIERAVSKTQTPGYSAFLAIVTLLAVALLLRKL